jgi:putative ABC transport system permease protein
VAPIRAEVRAVDPNLPVANVRTMDEVVATAMSQPRLAQWVLVLFGVMAMLLAAVGLYGVLSYVVSERQHEIGIRMAIGAEPRGVRSMVLWQGLGLAAAGIIAGTVVSLALARLIEGLLHGVAAHDPVTFIVVPAVLAGVAVLASWLPAWRATRVSPLLALKSE